MSAYDHRCADCQICPSCGRSAWCEGDRILVVPCEHRGYCGECNLECCRDCRVAADLERIIDGPPRDPFRRDDLPPDDDPWGPLAAESRAATDRFWSHVGDRSHVMKKDPDDQQ